MSFRSFSLRFLYYHVPYLCQPSACCDTPLMWYAKAKRQNYIQRHKMPLF
nr:MAG TPA: hypothetical protein [Caudoviricetes sp.]